MKIIEEFREDDNNSLLEKFSKEAHNVWCSWINNILENYQNSDSSIFIPIEKTNKWKKLLIPYENLLEEEKDKDREQAKKYLKLL